MGQRPSIHQCYKRLNDMWMIMVEKVIVNRDTSITFKVISGTEITV